jgi:hypothetical protein
MAEQTFLYATDSNIADSNMVAVSGSAIPELSGLTIIEQDSSNLQGPPVYLNSDGGNFRGTVTVGGMDAPEQSATGELAENVRRSTAYVSGAGAFPEYETLPGIAEKADSGNKINTINLLVNAKEYSAAGSVLSTATASARAPLYAVSGNVAQLIKFKTWNQNGPYNNLCPVDPTTYNRSAVGCMATASAQVLYYWRATKSITFSAGDRYVSIPEENKRIVINIDNDAARLDFATLATLNKSLSSIKYDFSDAEKAALSFGVGIKLKMTYSSDNSGAYLSSGVNAFKSAFGFISAGVLDVSKVAAPFSDAYVSVIVDNLQKGQPVITAITNNGNGGHAVIIDGFRESDQRFHFNMGWGGDSDGWYSLKSIPGFNRVEQYLIDVFPTGKANETYIVTNTNDYGVGSLRRAIEMANNKKGADTIVFDASLQGKTITLSSGQLQITDGLNIVGLGQKSLTISGGWNGGRSGSDIFYVGGDGLAGINVAFSGFTLTGGNADKGGAIFNGANLSLKNISINNSISSDYGGALCNQGVLTANALNIYGNRAVWGGGIANGGTCTISNSLISGNTATGNGGGVFNATGGIFKSYNCTISGNTAGVYGGGIFNQASMEINNTIVSRNSSRIYRDIAGQVIVSSRNNLVGDGGTSKLVNNVNGNKVGTADKQLDPGFVTSPDSVKNAEDADYRLLANSAAVNAGDNSVVSGDADLADNARLHGTVDIGAYEFQGEDNVLPSTPTGLAVKVAGQSATFDWSNATDSFGSVARYELQADRQADFKSPEYAAYFADSGATLLDISGGSYFWRVRTEDSAGNLSEWSKAATFSVTPADTAGSTLKTANNIDGAVDNWIGSSDAADIYKLTMTGNGALTLNLTGLEADVNLYLLSSNGSVIKASTGRGALPEAISKELMAGDYYVKVQLAAKGNASSYYTLAHEVNYFPADTAGNSFAAARNIASSGTVSEWLGFGDQSDFYKFELKTATAATFNLTGLENNVNLYLYNASGRRLALSAKNGSADESISKPLTAGVYYLQAAIAGSGNTDYNLNFGIDPAAFKVGSLQLFGNALPAVGGSAAALADDPAKKNQGMLA